MVVAEVSTMDSLGKRYGPFDRIGVANGEVEVLLVVGGYDVDWGMETEHVNMYADINKSKMGAVDGPCELQLLTWTRGQFGSLPIPGNPPPGFPWRDSHRRGPSWYFWLFS